MSYDLFLFVPSDDDLERSATLALEAEDDRARNNRNRRDPVLQARRIGAAKALLSQDSTRQISPELESLEETLAAGRPLPTIVEIDCPVVGVSITLASKSGGLSVPYWYAGDRAREVFEQVWAILELIQSESGMHAYDQQVGKVLNPRTDAPVVLDAYAYGVTQTKHIAGQTSRQPRPNY